MGTWSTWRAFRLDLLRAPRKKNLFGCRSTQNAAAIPVLACELQILAQYTAESHRIAAAAITCLRLANNCRAVRNRVRFLVCSAAVRLGCTAVKPATQCAHRCRGRRLPCAVPMDHARRSFDFRISQLSLSSVCRTGAPAGQLLPPPKLCRALRDDWLSWSARSSRLPYVCVPDLAQG